MLSQRTLLRASQRVRSSAFQSATRRQYAAQDAGATGLRAPADNDFNRERAAVKKHARDTSDFWRKLSIYVVVPCLTLAGINAWNLWNEHWEHWAHEPPLDERPEYPYQNLRTKNYFWGDGDKTLFWNDKVNHHKKGE